MLLVTGGTGMLGRNLLESVRSPCCFTGRQIELGEQVERETGHRFYAVDLSTDCLDVLPEGINEIVHCAALSSPWGSAEDFHRHNVEVTERLLQFALKRRVKRFVFISTPSLYFDFRNRLDIPESFKPKQPVNHYAASKRAAEDLLYDYRHHFDIVVLRPRGIFGKYDNAIVPRLMKLASSGGIPLCNDGKARIDLTHVSNVVHAIRLSLELPPACGRVITCNITNDEPMSVNALLQLLADTTQTPITRRSVPGWLISVVANVSELCGRVFDFEPKLTRYTASLLRYDQTLDISLAKKLLGYAPVTSIAEGMKHYQVSERGHD
jgi:nucleoside-diphosphate-sugar epimerase